MNYKAFFVIYLRRAVILLTAFLPFFQCFAKEKEDCLVLYGESSSFKKGIEAFTNDIYADAEKYFKDEIAEHPDNGLAYFYLAMISKENMNVDAFDANMKKAVKNLGGKANKPHKASCHAYVGDVLMQVGYFEVAIYHYSKAIGLDKTQPQYLEKICDASFAAGYHREEKKYSERLMKEFPDNAYGYFAMGRYLFLNQKEPQGALGLFNMALEKDSCLAAANDLKAVLLIETGNWEEAFSNLFRAMEGGETMAMHCALDLMEEDQLRIIDYVERHPTEAEGKWHYPFLLGLLFMYTGQYDKAVEQISRVIELEPSAGEYESLAICHMMKGNFRKALEAAESAILLSQEDAAYVRLKADICYIAGEYAKARETIDAFHRKYPYDDNLGVAEAVYYATEGRHDDAKTLLDRLSTKKNDVTALNYEKGRVLQMKGDTEEAAVCFKRAVKKTHKKDDGDLLTCATAYARLGNAEKAMKITNEVISRHSRDGMVYFLAASVAAILGDNPVSLSYLEKAHKYCGHTMPLCLRDYDFKDLRKTPEFDELITRLMPELKENGHISTSPQWQ